jgi:hypothetical protein
MEESAGRHNYINSSWGRRLVAEYTGLNFHQVGQLDYGTYLLWRRDAFIKMMSSSEEGLKYLDDAWRMEQTKPDRAKLRKFTGKEPAANGE